MHFLYLSNGNFLSQKEQTTLVVTAAGMGPGVGSVASSSVNPLSFLGCSFEEWFIESFIGLLTFCIYFEEKKKQKQMQKK